MDIARPDLVRKLSRRRRLWLLLGAVVLIGLLAVASRLRPAAPVIRRADIWIGSARRGNLLRRVQGLGKLVPIQDQVIPAPVNAQVEQVLALPGAEVKPRTVLLLLNDPQLQQQALGARGDWRAAQAQLQQQEAELQEEMLAQQATAARSAADAKQAAAEAQADATLLRKGLIPRLDADSAAGKAASLKTQSQADAARLRLLRRSLPARLAVLRTQIESKRAYYELLREEITELTVRAGIRGVLEDLPVQTGAQVGSGEVLARVADPTKLKAQLKIAEDDAHELRLGQPASIDTHDGLVPGHVIRIDPSVHDGTVAVDVALDAPLPPGARPDLSVEGRIDLNRLNNVIYIQRPALVQDNTASTLFRLNRAGTEAVRVPVRFGQGSVTLVEVLQGLHPGDQVILSDTSEYNRDQRLQVK